MSFQNIYYKRTTATSRTCYVCNKPTTVCLATSNAVDFLYTCEAHLSDTGFATALVDPSTASASASNVTASVSPEEIARVKAEWEAKEARKEAKEKGNGKTGAEGEEKEKGEKGEEESRDGKRAKSPSPSIPGGVSSSSSSSSPTGSSAAATPTHKRYSLHRDFYAMRQAEHRRKRQTKQMQELAPRLPGAPRGSPLG